MKPEVSIIVACFNKEKFIRQSISSVLKQSFANLEVIIVDDNSSDKSVELIKAQTAADPRITLIVNAQNKGANFCRNLGIKTAVGKYLIFFDADDILAKECLMRRVTYMNEHASLDFSVFTMQVFSKEPGDGTHNWLPYSADPLKSFLSHDLPWQTMQPIWKKEILVKSDGFDETFERLQDVELHTRLLLKKDLRFDMENGEPDCFYRTDDSRKNYEEALFLSRWINASIQFCEKFATLVKPHQKKYLYGTVFQTYLSLLLARRAQKISEVDMKSFEEKLLSQELMKQAPARLSFILKLSKAYNLYFIRVPGLNRFLKRLLVLN